MPFDSVIGRRGTSFDPRKQNTMAPNSPSTHDFAGGAGRLAADRWGPTIEESQGVILMLHGGGQTRHSWDRAATRFADEGWTVFTVDSRGHGESAWDTEARYGMDDLADDVRAIVEQLSESAGYAISPVIFGASMGGITGLLTEGEHPGFARALVLVDITPRIEPSGIKRITDFMTGSPDGFADLEEVANAVAAYQPHRVRPRNIEGLRKNIRVGEGGRLYWHWDPAFHRLGPNLNTPQDNHDRLVRAAAAVSCPTLLVHGAESDIVSQDGVDELLASIPRSQSFQVSGAGHMVAGDDNSVFVDKVGDFLSQLPATQPR